MSPKKLKELSELEIYKALTNYDFVYYRPTVNGQIYMYAKKVEECILILSCGLMNEKGSGTLSFDHIYANIYNTKIVSLETELKFLNDNFYFRQLVSSGYYIWKNHFTQLPLQILDEGDVLKIKSLIDLYYQNIIVESINDHKNFNNMITFWQELEKDDTNFFRYTTGDLYRKTRMYFYIDMNKAKACYEDYKKVYNERNMYFEFMFEHKQELMKKMEKLISIEDIIGKSTEKIDEFESTPPSVNDLMEKLNGIYFVEDNESRLYNSLMKLEEKKVEYLGNLGNERKNNWVGRYKETTILITNHDDDELIETKDSEAENEISNVVMTHSAETGSQAVFLHQYEEYNFIAYIVERGEKRLRLQYVHPDIDKIYGTLLEEEKNIIESEKSGLNQKEKIISRKVNEITELQAGPFDINLSRVKMNKIKL